MAQSEIGYIDQLAHRSNELDLVQYPQDKKCGFKEVDQSSPGKMGR